MLKIIVAETIYGLWRDMNEIFLSQKHIDTSLKDNILQSIVTRCIMHKKLNIPINVVAITTTTFTTTIIITTST